MSRGAQTFKQRDVTKAIRAAVKAGVKGWRVEIDKNGKITLTSAESSSSLSDDLDRELADFEARRGQG
jgi:hypothetical protein